MTYLNFINLIKDWKISYNSYSDLFQIYDFSILSASKKTISEKKDKYIRVILDKSTKEPRLFEIKNVSRNLGVEIDNLDKKDIIRLIKQYFYKYV